MASIAQLTRLARLSVAESAVVCEELKAYAAEVRASPYSALNDELERMLLQRNDTLIDISLASYGACAGVVAALFRKGGKQGRNKVMKQGLRLAVLANETVNASGMLSQFPMTVICPEDLTYVLKEAPLIEAKTLLLNPTLADDVFLAVYKGEGVAEGIDDRRRSELVAISAQSDRVLNRDDNEFGPDMGHYYIHKAIWSMLKTVPTSRQWLYSLDCLLRRLTPSQVQRPDAGLDAVLERWLVDENGEPEKPNDDDRYNESGLNDRAQFRCLIAALYGKGYKDKKEVIHGSPEDKDAAKRSAYYANGSLDVKAIEAAHLKNPKIFVFAAMLNDGMLLNRKARRFFEEECLNGSHADRYRDRCEQLHKRWPWFDPRPTIEWMVDDETERTKYATERQVREVQTSVAELRKFAANALFFFALVLGLIEWLR